MRFLAKEIDPDVSYIFVIKYGSKEERPGKEDKEEHRNRIDIAMAPMVRSEGVNHKVVTIRNFGALVPSGPGELPPLRADKQIILFGFEEAEQKIDISPEEKEEVIREIEEALINSYNPKDLPGKLSFALFYNASIEQIIDIPSRQFYKTPGDILQDLQEKYPNFEVIPTGEGEYRLQDPTPLSYTIGGDGISDY